MKYDKSRLIDADWHKIVWHPKIESKFIEVSFRAKGMQLRAWLSENAEGDFMVKNGGLWFLIMLKEKRDVALMTLKFDLNEDSYRGCGDWSKHKYSSAKTNRMA